MPGNFTLAETVLALNLMLIGRFAAKGKTPWYNFLVFATGLSLLAAASSPFITGSPCPFPPRF